MATTYVSLANLQKYDDLLKQYIANGWYDKTETDGFLSEIEEREANFIDITVDDLINYYTKSDTYTKEEIQSLIETIPTFSIAVVDELPTEDISTTTIYLLRNSETGSQNLYTEYIYVNDQWENLGQQTIDLSDYYTKEEVDALIPTKTSDLENDAEFISEDDIVDRVVLGIRGDTDLEYRKGYIDLDKRMVGLSLVENKSVRQIIAQITVQDIITALGYYPMDISDYVPNGIGEDGYVAKTNGVPNKVWGTDDLGYPGWIDGTFHPDPSTVVTGVKGEAETSYRKGEVNISPTNIGLGNVENKSSQTIRNELTTAEVLEKIGILPIENGGTGNANGYIQTGKVASSNVGTASTVEGKNNTVTGKQSHAEGYGNRVTSNYSHAEGYNTVASGSTSHSEGTATVAGYANQHVSGKYNSNKNNTLLEVGNGESTSVRTNAFEVYNDGYISTGEGAKIKFDKNANDEYGYYKDGSSVFTPFGSGGGGGLDVSVQNENLIFYR